MIVGPTKFTGGLMVDDPDLRPPNFDFCVESEPLGSTDGKEKWS